MSRELIDIKQIDVSKLNDVKIYDELPLEVEGQVAYCTGDGKLYYGDGSEWKEISTGEVNPNDIILDTTNFDKNLDTTITDVQKLADAVDEFDLGGLPTPIANRILRANGTNWITTTNSSLTDGNTDTEFRLANNALPDKKYLRAFVNADGTGIQVRSDTVSTSDTRYASIYSSPTEASVYLITGVNQFIDLHTDNNMQYLFMRPNGTISEQGLRVQTTRNYSATSTIFEFTGKFKIYQNGKIVSNYLSGTGSSLLEVLSDGTIQRSTQVIPKGEIVNIETLTTNKTLIANDATIQMYTSTASRTINLPTTGLTLGQKFEIWNKNNNEESYVLTIRYDSTSAYYLDSGRKIELRWDGSKWMPEWNTNVSIGTENYSNYNNAIAIGYNAHSNYTNGIGVGNSAGNNSTYGIGIGAYASDNHHYGIGIGYNSNNNSNYGVGIGAYSSANNYSVSMGAYAGKGQTVANRLYIHSSSSTVGTKSLIYGEFDNRIVKINNTLYVNDLVGTGDRPIVADSAGKLKIGSAVTGGRNYKEFTSPEIAEGNSTSSVAYSNTQLGLDSINLNDKIKMVQCYVIKSGYQDVKNNILIKGHIMNNDNINIETNELLTGGDRIKIYIEYID